MNKKNINNNKIKEKFTEIIREKMNNKQFWNWVSNWIDTEEIIKQAENWNTKDKKDLIKEWEIKN
jgi:hypothetical protein